MPPSPPSPTVCLLFVRIHSHLATDPRYPPSSPSRPLRRPRLLRRTKGYHNVGWHGNPEVRTPTLDGLAMTGVRLEHHYTYKYCR